MGYNSYPTTINYKNSHMKRTILTIIVALVTFSIACYAGQIYEEARQAGINYYDHGQYHQAAEQFLSAQNIAPVNNDLSSWIIKCNNKMIQSRNARIKSMSNTQNSIQSVGQKVERYDSIGRYGSANLALVRYQNKYGFVDRDSIIVVPMRYDDVYSTITEAVTGTSTSDLINFWNVKWAWSWDKGQLMSVSKNGKWGYINELGNEVIPIIYDDVRESIVFKGRNLIGVGQNEKYGFVDWEGSVVIPLKYDHVTRFYNGVFGTNVSYDMVPVVKNGKMGFIDERGNTVIPFEYEPQYNLEYSVPVMFRPVWFDGITYLKKDGKFGIVDSKGNAITGFKYDGKGEVDFVNINGDYKPYYSFPYNNKTVYYFQGKEYDSEDAFNQEVTRLTLYNRQNNTLIPQVRIIDTQEQAKDPDYISLKLFKEEIATLSAANEIKKFNSFSEGVAVIELRDGICLLFPDKDYIVLKGVSVYWPHYNSGLLGCCYNRNNANSSLDGFYLDKNGEIAISHIKLGNGKETVIGSSYGKKICAGPFGNNYARTWHYKGTNAKRGLINLNGELVIPCEYDNVYHITNGYIAEKGDNVYFLNSQGSVIEKVKNAGIRYVSSSEFTIYVWDEGYRKYSNSFECLEKSTNTLYLPNQYNRHISVSSGKYGYCDDNGRIVIPIQYQKAEDFSDGLASICIDGKHGFIDTAGNIVIEPMFEDAGAFHDGIAWVKNGDNYYYINKTGKILNGEKYSYAEDFHNGFGIVKKNGHYGIVARSGLSTFDIM